MLVARRLFPRFRCVLRGTPLQPFGGYFGRPLHFGFAKISKKKEERIEKTKEKEQARSKVANSKEIDLEAM